MAQRGTGLEWQRAQVVLSGAVVAALTVAALYWARTILIPVALAVFLAFVLGPVVVWFQRRGLGRTVSVVVVVGLALVVSGGLGTLVGRQIASLSAGLPDRRDAIVGKLTQARAAVLGDGESRLGSLVAEVVAVFVPPPERAGGPAVVVQPAGPGWVGQLEAYATPAVEVAGQAAFAFLLTVFMLLKREDLRNRMIRLTGHGKVTTTTKAVDDASRRVSRFLLTQLALNAGFAAVILVVMLLMGVKYALLWAGLALVMRYIPYIGSWLALIPPTLYVFATTDGWGMTVGVVALYGVLELIANNVFEPVLYGPSMGLSEVAQLVAAGFWAFLWGPVGLVLSGPLTVCLLVLGKHVSRFEFLDVLLGDEPVLPERVAFYQRLTARDQDEASQIALTAVGDADATAVFDRLVVPALCLAKRDHADGDLHADALAFAVRASREIGEEVALAAPNEKTPADAPVRVLVTPSRDEIDLVAAELFGKILDPGRWAAEVVTTELLAAELLARIEATDPAAVVIASLPPGGVAHTRYLVARIRGRFPHLKVVVGRWGRGEDFQDAGAAVAGADWVDGTLADTRRRLEEWRGVFASAATDEPTREVGTPAALVG